MNGMLLSALASGELRSVDVHLARHLLALAGTDDADASVALAIALLSRAGAGGDVCLDLAAVSGSRPFGTPVTAPPLDVWRAALASSGLVADSHEAADTLRPLVLDGANRLYLHKAFAREQAVVADLAARLAGANADHRGHGPLTTNATNATGDTCGASDGHGLLTTHATGAARGADNGHGLLAAGAADAADAVPLTLDDAIARAFPGRGADDEQAAAVARAATGCFTVIAGGPGTGKTTTVTRLLAVLLLLAGEHPLRIALAAPTGKAAARLSESVGSVVRGLENEGLPTDLLARLPVQATTIHRLLGWLPGGAGGKRGSDVGRGSGGVRGGGAGRFRHHAAHPLPVDVLVVDEASMIDLSLMASLLDAVPPQARLILLGDPDQLASVEAGNVLGDLCNHGGDFSGDRDSRYEETAEPPIARRIVRLRQGRRFRATSGIGALARAANAGDADGVLAAFAHHVDITHHDIDAAALPAACTAETRAHLVACRHATCPAEALAAFNRFRFLCALRDGPFGVHSLNRLVERALARDGLVDPRTPHYAGRPLLITRNDYASGLFNGDTGLVLPDDDGVLRAFFPVGQEQVRQVALNRLPAHETCFAMTVHKAQGSEFARVVLVLPDADNPVLTRELVYTGITRAGTSLALWSRPDILAMAVNRRVVRTSGLRDALWNGG